LTICCWLNLAMLKRAIQSFLFGGQRAIDLWRYNEMNLSKQSFRRKVDEHFVWWLVALEGTL
jgi:hypothetical protein